MALLDERLIPVNRGMFNLFNASVGLFGIDNTAIASMTTWAGTDATTSFEGLLRAKTPAENLVPLQRHIADNLKMVATLGLSTDQALADANTVATTRAIFTTNDSNLSGTAFTTFALPVQA